VYAKCEFFNPGASVKDRLAIAIIEDAEARGTLKPGQTVVEATSGNTGIALAMVCAAKGYPFVAVMVETFSIERRKIMRMFGARVILTPAAGAAPPWSKGRELAQKHGWFLASQFENPANPAYHRNTTGPEILSDFAGKRLDYFVTGWGTGGTLTGAGEMLRLARPDMHIIAVEPEAAAMLSGKPFAPHKIQGWTPDFVPAVLNRTVPDRIVTVTDAEAIATARALARRRASSAASPPGGTFAAALNLAREVPRRARCCWPCCPTPASATCPPHYSKESPMARIRNPEPRIPARSTRNTGTSASCARERRPEPRAARSASALSRRRVAWRAHRLRELGPLNPARRQRHSAVHRTVALGARGRDRAGSHSGLVAAHDRPGSGARYQPLFRHLREFARQLLWLDRAGLDRSGHRASATA
jgi:cysteine synthase A